jgi:hypothetical protein
MKILLIEDRETRQKKFTKIDFSKYEMIDNKIGDGYKEIKKAFDDEKFELNEYDVIISHRSAFGENNSKVLSKLNAFCKENKKKLIFFSGGISVPFYTTTPFEFLSINSKELYGNNLELFLEDAKTNNHSNLLLLAYGKNWELNILLNTLETINMFLVENNSNSFDYSDFQEDTKYKTIEKLIDFEEYNSGFTKEDIEKIKVKIFQKVHTLLGVNHV